MSTLTAVTAADDEGRLVARARSGDGGALMAAVRDSADVATFERRLEDLAGVRREEQALEAREEARLAEFLDARQRATFLIMRMRFNDQVRELRGRRGPADGPPAG